MRRVETLFVVGLFLAMGSLATAGGLAWHHLMVVQEGDTLTPLVVQQIDDLRRLRNLLHQERQEHGLAVQTAIEVLAEQEEAARQRDHQQRLVIDQLRRRVAELETRGN